MSDRTCSIAGCSKPSRARGWCQAHYALWRKNGDPLVSKSPTRNLDIEGTFRFYMPGDPPPVGDVWKWAGPLDTNGYGIFQCDNKRHYAHRVAYEIFIGPIGPGLVVRHRLDIPIDVNPGNLELGSTADNIRDRDDRDRTARGTSIGTAKLDDAAVRAIRSMYSQGLGTYRTLGKQFGVDKSIIGDVVLRRTWKHV